MRVVCEGIIFARGDSIVLLRYRRKRYSCGCGEGDVVVVRYCHAFFVHDFEIARNRAVCKVVFTHTACRGGEDERQNVSLAYTDKDVAGNGCRQSLSVVFFVKDDI